QRAPDSRGGAQLSGLASSGHAQDQEPLRSERVGKETVPAEGHRPGASGRQSSSDSPPRRYGLRSYSPRLLLQDEREGEEERAEVGALAAGQGREAGPSQRPRRRRSEDESSGREVHRHRRRWESASRRFARQREPHAGVA